MKQSKTVWNSPKQSETVQNILKHSETVWNSSKLSETVWNSPKHYKTVWNSQKQSETAWNSLIQSKTFWNSLKCFETACRSLKKSETVWSAVWNRNRKVCKTRNCEEHCTLTCPTQTKLNLSKWINAVIFFTFAVPHCGLRGYSTPMPWHQRCFNWYLSLIASWLRIYHNLE